MGQRTSESRMLKKRRLRKFWTGKKVVITGASSGLGYALVRELAQYKVSFGLFARRDDVMQSLAKELKHTGSQFFIKACDVQKREEIENAIREFHTKENGLDVVWVNSGVGGETSFRVWNWDRMEAMIDTNLKGAVYTTEVSRRIMAAQGKGTIAGICSIASIRGLPTKGIYSATKIALETYLEAVSIENPELQVTIIHPGYVDTAINSGQPNRFFLMNPPKAAKLMVNAVAKKKLVFIFPWQMKILFRFARLLPARVYRWLFTWGPGANFVRPK